MAVKKYEYKEGTRGSLILCLDFHKLTYLNNVQSAFNILSRKGRSKAVYITNAVNYYKSLGDGCKELDNIYSKINLFKEISLMFNIRTREDIIKCLEEEPAGSSLPEVKPGRKMMCGFNEADPRAVKMHKELYDMAANDRLIFVSDAVCKYVEDGQDGEEFLLYAKEFLHDSAVEYNSGNKNVVDDFEQMLKLAGIM